MYIVATISKNSYTADKIEEIVQAGASVLRYNFSHGDPQEMAQKVTTAREVITKLGLMTQVKILADLPGNKIRLGKFDMGNFPVQKGQEVIFKSAKESSDPEEFVPVDFPQIGKLVSANQLISCGDGEIGLQVTSIIDGDTFKAIALNAWHIPALKGLNIGRGLDELNHFTPATLEHIKHLALLKPEWVAFSFVRSSKDIDEGRALLAPHVTPEWNPKIVAKIESPQAIERIDEIAQAVDILLVARGDLGLAMPIELLGISQKKVLAAGKKAGKEVIVSTQILDSLLSYYIPSRAEVLDLTNSVLDGADGIMLAKETGISLTPGYSVATAKKIIETVENEGSSFKKSYN